MLYKDRIILITGGTGSWGNELACQLLLENPTKIRIFSRGELAQVDMKRRFNDPRLEFIIGDVRDADALEKACRGVDYIFHLAALKHVNICEEQPLEAIKTNINGTANVIRAAIKNRVIKMVDVSTDKAVVPLNLYGMTKGIGERLTVQAGMLSGETRFVCIRAGNVVGSNGSVVPLFINQIKKNNRITITDRRMTRFLITLPEAIHLLFKAAQASFGGEIFVVRMPSCKILDLAKVLIEHYGNAKTKIVYTGLRPGEKIHEVLLSCYETENSYYYNDRYFMIKPMLDLPGLTKHYDSFSKMKKVDFMEYTSKDELMNREEIIKLLLKSGFIEEKEGL